MAWTALSERRCGATADAKLITVDHTEKTMLGHVPPEFLWPAEPPTPGRAQKMEGWMDWYRECQSCNWRLLLSPNNWMWILSSTENAHI